MAHGEVSPERVRGWVSSATVKDQRLISKGDRVRLNDYALARAVPESIGWKRANSAATSGSLCETEYWVEVRSPLRPAVQRLNILLRHDGDIQVEYHIADKPGSPFEMLFVLTAGREAQAIEAVSLFVAELIAERLVLADAKGLFRGGRRFLKPSSLTESGLRNINWIIYWLGTADWPTPV